MSLINEMLRDLESRRRSGDRQLPSGEQPTAMPREFVSRRWLLLALTGVALAVVIWLAAGRQLTGDAATAEVSLAVVTAPEVSAPEKQGIAEPIIAAIPEAEQTTVAAASVDPPSARVMTPQVEPEMSASTVAVSPGAAPVESLQLKPFQPPPEKRLSKTKVSQSPQQQAEQLYRSAQQQLKTRALSPAVDQLVQALSLDSQLLEARLLAIDLLTQLQRPQEAAQLLEAGLQLQPDSFELRKRSARRLLTQGDGAAALVLLQAKPLPLVAEDSGYHALLAAVLRENAAYREAAGVYRQLLDFRSREPLWWLGLAISLEQAGVQAEAKSAYQQALALPGLQLNLIDYIKGRLQVL